MFGIYLYLSDFSDGCNSVTSKMEERKSKEEPVAAPHRKISTRTLRYPVRSWLDERISNISQEQGNMGHEPKCQDLIVLWQPSSKNF